MQFSLEQLNALVAVVEKGSFSEAALKLGKHRTTVGQAITTLEDTLAVELFERIGRKAKATDDAKLLYHYAKLTIEQAKAFDKIALSLSYGELEEINIGYCSFIPNAMLVSIRLRLQSEMPQTKVNFLVCTKQEIKEGITEGTIQFGIVNIDNRTARHSFDTTLLSYINFSLFASAKHPLNQLPKEEIYGSLKITRQLVLKSYIDDDIADKVLVSANVEVIEDISLLVSLVEQGVGFSLLPRVIIEQLKEPLSLVNLQIDQLNDDFRFPISLWSPHSKPLIKTKKYIKEAINEYLLKIIHIK